MSDRVRSQVVGLSTVALGQGVPFFHAGTDLLRSKSLDRNRYDSGDWFNRLSFDHSSNNFGVGLPPRVDNESKWPFMQPLLADPALRPTAAAIGATTTRFQEFLRIRDSSPLFRLGSASEVSSGLSFANTGPDQIPGVIVMRLSDTVGRNLDPDLRSIVVVFTGSDLTHTVALASAVGAKFKLHDVQQRGSDKVVKHSKFKQKTGSFTVPPRTTAVFVETGPPPSR